MQPVIYAAIIYGIAAVIAMLVAVLISVSFRALRIFTGKKKG
ncbi:hypothetical protein M2103_000771 [Ereboglobus sp. PH5-5]|nr:MULTISPECIES: hypothetical protein [unclassified Ereboglobus]MDF9827142.1 hypothetical protein [Ereboglobus sp. PH5-10]MDF9832561.1 hypothetical protein [Ereboglobus sp. PH5-5]